MDSDDSYINDLVAGRTVKDFGGDFSIVTVPGLEALTEPEKAKVYAKLETLESQLLITSHQVDSALLSRLQDLTPPLDPEAEEEESRSIEDQARKALEKEGCPPCYPTDLKIPLRDIPKQYQGIILYWKSFAGTDDLILRAQLSDWEQFRRSQKKTRQQYRHKPFSDFEEKVRERRRRHQLGGNVRLQSDSGQQSRLENWTEFQNYHLQNHERLEKKRDDRKEALDIARKKAEGADAAGVECAAGGPNFQYMLETAERKLGYHENLLRWIEQERMVMDAVQPPSVEGDYNNQDGGLKAIRMPSKFDRRKRRLKAHEVLGKVRVSKSEPRKRNMQRQKRKVPEAQPAIEDSGPPQRSVSRNPDSLGGKPRSTNKKTALSQMRPQRVSKDKRFADSSAKSSSATSLRRVGPKRAPDRARPKYQQSPQRPQPAVVKTKSGRVSRRPEVWAPDTW